MSQKPDYDRGYNDGVRFAISWLHKRARCEMNDPHARQILNSGATNLGWDFQRIREDTVPLPIHVKLANQYRAEFGQQPLTETDDLAASVKAFESALPGWWWSVCVCSRTRDASCGPDLAGPDHALLAQRLFDDGFHCDDAEGTLASSLRDVMQQAIDARAAASRSLPVTNANDRGEDSVRGTADSAAPSSSNPNPIVEEGRS